MLTADGDVLDLLLENVKLIPDTKSYLKYNSTGLIEIHCLDNNPTDRTSVDVDVKVNVTNEG